MTSLAAQPLLPPDRPETARIAELDGLRAIAIGAVLGHHLLPLPGHWPLLGFGGVGLFFVLSGFLITRILLGGRERLSAGRTRLRRELGVFYARRTLRIFPVYYATLLVLWLLGVQLVDERIVYHLTYTSNWLFAFPERLALGGYDRHLWTLAVEEQFYLLWPAVVLLTPRRLLPLVVIAAMLLGPLWRAWFTLRVGPDGQTWPWTWSQFPTPASFDLLAGGALLALAWQSRWRKPIVWTSLLIGLPTTMVALVLQPTDTLLHWRAIGQASAMALLFIALVAFAAAGLPGLAGRVLGWGPIAYVGKISYAMYLWHVFAGPAARWVLATLGIEAEELTVGIVAIILTTAAAALSWHLFEGPINNLKRFVPYETKPTPART